MSTTLTNGLKLPDKGSVDWYADMQGNYAILDGAVGTIAEHTSALAGKAPLVHTHSKADITDFPAYGTTAGTICEGNDSRLSDARTPVAHTHTKSDVTDLFNSANTWSANNKFTDNVSIEKNSPSPTTISDSSLALNGNSNYVYFRTKGSSNFKTYNSWLWAGYLGPGYAGEERMGHLKIYRASDTYGATGEETPDTSFSFIDVALHFKKVNITDNVSFKNDGTINACYPAYNNATDLGISTNKWKTFNGLNPGTLSLPDISSAISIDTTNWDLTNYSANFYTPSADGWIFFGGTTDVIQIDGAINYGITVTKGYDGFCEAFLPVFKDKRLQCRFKNCTLLKSAKFYPCLGNV